MRLIIHVVTDKETLKRWNFKEEGIEFYNNHRHCAIPLSKITGRGLKVMLENWYKPSPSEFISKEETKP